MQTNEMCRKGNPHDMKFKFRSLAWRLYTYTTATRHNFFMFLTCLSVVTFGVIAAPRSASTIYTFFISNDENRKVRLGHTGILKIVAARSPVP